MSENVNGTQVQGKGMAITGFVLALLGLLLNSIVAGISILAIAAGGSGWLMYVWLVLNIVALVMCIMAMSKMKKSGGKAGLAIAGMIIAIIGTIYAIILTLGMNAAAGLASSAGDEFKKELENIDWKKELENLEDAQ